MTSPITKPMLDAPLKPIIRNLLSDLINNGYIDLKTGKIESKCDPETLRFLVDFARQGQDVALQSTLF